MVELKLRRVRRGAVDRSGLAWPTWLRCAPPAFRAKFRHAPFCRWCARSQPGSLRLQHTQPREQDKR